MGVFQFNLWSRVYKICHHKLVNEDKNMPPTVDAIAAANHKEESKPIIIWSFYMH